MVNKKEVDSPETKGSSKDSATVASATAKDAKQADPKPAAVVSPTIALEKQPIIMVKQLSKSFRDRVVLKDVNFEVSQKDIFGLIGMSGSGKTTLFQLMAGIENPDSGDVVVRKDLLFDVTKKFGKNLPDYLSVFKRMPLVKQRFGFASQFASFYAHMTVGENLVFYGSLYDLEKKKLPSKVDDVLRLVGLEDEKETLASDLSGGMQRRLDIACAIIHDPIVLFMDEPTSDLDPILRRQIWALIKEINSRGTTVIVTSHILDEIESLCTKVAILHDKRVLGYGPLSELKKMFQKGQQVRIEFSPQKYDGVLERMKKKGVEIDRSYEKDGMLVVVGPRDDKNTDKILVVVKESDERLVRIDVSDANLAEIFDTLGKKKV